MRLCQRTNVRSICNEIAKLDLESAISEARKHRIIIYGLNSKYHWIVIVTRDWAKESTLVELKNILINQEALDKQMSKVLIKEEDKALFAKKKAPRGEITIAKSNTKGKISSRRQQHW